MPKVKRKHVEEHLAGKSTKQIVDYLESVLNESLEIRRELWEAQRALFSLGAPYMTPTSWNKNLFRPLSLKQQIKWLEKELKKARKKNEQT